MCISGDEYVSRWHWHEKQGYAGHTVLLTFLRADASLIAELTACTWKKREEEKEKKKKNGEKSASVFNFDTHGLTVEPTQQQMVEWRNV